jgi:dihydroxy-acid dehydratase
MDAKTQLKARLPGRHVTEGPERAPARSYYYAMGLTTDQIHQPFVGVVAASGGSANAAPHLPAIAHACAIAFDLFDVAEVFKRTLYIADLKPGGRHVAKDSVEARAIPLLMKSLLDHGFMHGDRITVTNRTEAENLERANREQDDKRPADKPLSPSGGVIGLTGNFAPEGAIVKVAGTEKLVFSGPARCFDGEEACFEAVKTHKYRDGDVHPGGAREVRSYADI